MSETSPPPSEAVIQTAARLLAAGRAMEAADRLQQLVDAAPTYAAAHVLLASALDASGRPQDALEVWRRAAFLVPHSPLVHRERQRLMETLSAPDPPAEPAEAPVEAWDEAPVDPGVELAPEAETVPAETAPSPDEAQLGEASSDDTPDLASSEDPAPAPSSDLLDSLLDVSAPPDVEPPPRVERDLPETPEPPADEPREVPLLPPEGDASSAPRPSVPDLDLADDGWTILEDDISPSEPDAPTPTAVLPPEPDSTFSPAPPSPPAPDPPLDPEPAPAEPDSSIADDLDDLITQLDAAPRIKPDPTFNGPKMTFDDSSMDDMVSETLAKIYAAQHQYVEAAVVYEKLAEREPDHAAEMLERAAEMRDKAS